MARESGKILYPLKESKRPMKYGTFDIETTEWINEFALGFFDGQIYYLFEGKDCCRQFLKFFLRKRYQGYHIFGHNAGRFDSNFLLQTFLDGRKTKKTDKTESFQLDLIKSSSRIFQIKIFKDRRSWYINDSLALLRGSLQKLTEDFKVKHVKQKIDYDKIKEQEWREYLEYDVLGLYEVLEKFLYIMNSKFHCNFEITLARQALKVWRKCFQPFALPTYLKHEPFIRQSYYGGRCEIFNLHGEELNYYDVNSLYPNSMVRDMPIGKPWFTKKPKEDDLAFCQAIVEVPKMYCPPLPYRQKTKTSQVSKLLFPTGKLKGTWSYDELKLAEDMNCKVKYIKSLVFQGCDLFSKYVNELYKMKKNNKDNCKGFISKILMNCFSSDTNIFTENGVKNIRDVKVGEKVYSISPKTLEVQLKSVVKTYKYPYSGDMFHIEGCGMNFLVTPNHRFLLKKGKQKEYKWYYTEQLLKAQEWNFPQFTPIKGKIKKTIKVGPYEFKMNDWLQLMGWFISEGSLYKFTKKQGGSSRVCITQWNKKNYNQIDQLLLNLGFILKRKNRHITKITGKEELTYCKNSGNFYIHNKIIYNWLLENCGKGAFNKKIPKFVFELDRTQLVFLYKTLMMGDGYLKRRSANSNQMLKYYTISHQLSEDFARLCLHIGLKTRVGPAKIESKNQRTPHHTIFIYRHKKNGTYLSKYQKHISIKKYKGHVYCLTVQGNHTVLAGRENKFEFIGQSLYGKFASCRQRKQIIMFPEDTEGLTPVFEEMGIYEKETYSNASFILPAISAQITSLARIHLYNLMKKVDFQIFYSDTDSLVTTEKLPTGPDLGELKLEHRVDEGIWLLPKVYALQVMGPNYVPIDDPVIRLKGFPLKDVNVNFNSFKKALYKDNYGDFVSEKSIFGMFSENMRRQRRAVAMTTRKRSIISKYDKRTVMKDFDTRPLTF